MTKNKFYTAKYDRVFKTVLCDEDDKELLQEFLSRILERKVDGEYIHIELNSTSPNYLHVRNFIFFSTLFSKKTQRGEEYDLVTKFIHIDLTYGMKKDKDVIKYYVQSKDLEKYLENFEIIEYNMDRIMKYWYNKDIQKVNQYKHLIMLDLEETGLKDLSKGDDFVKKFEDKITRLNEQETFQSAMTYEQDQKLILNTEKRISYNEGIEQGTKERNIEIAKSMLNDNIDLELISKYTNLTVSEIKSLE